MNQIRLWQLSALCLAGWVVGYGANRLAAGWREPAREPRGEPVPAARGAARPSAVEPAPGGTQLPVEKRPADTLASLTAAAAGPRYARLARWLMDASGEEIAAYWAGIRDQRGRPDALTDLIFIHWTRLDPQGAIAAVAGSGSERFAWWAWACHDPQAALAAAVAANPDHVNNVAWGIGEFHPQWLREHFDEIPESGRRDALAGMAKWDDADDPLAVLEFLREHGHGFNLPNLATLARRDPWAAFDWMQQHGEVLERQFGSPDRTQELLFETMAESQPAALERLMEQTPGGEMKRRMETAWFDQLVRTDPAAALEQALATRSPLVASQRLATVGLTVLTGDREEAFGIAGRLLADGANALYSKSEVRFANGSSAGFSTNMEVEEFVDALLAVDPARTLALAAPSANPSRQDDTGYQQLLGKWANLDLDGYAAWVATQTEPGVRDLADRAVVAGLLGQLRYAEAARWAMQTDGGKRTLPALIGRWGQDHPEAAREWLEATALPADEKARLNQALDPAP